MPKIKGSRINSVVFQGFQETNDGGSVFQSAPCVLYPKEEICGMRAAGTSHILGLYGIPSGQGSWLLKKQTWEHAASSGGSNAERKPKCCKR